MTQEQFRRDLWTGAEPAGSSSSAPAGIPSFDLALHSSGRRWVLFLVVVVGAVLLGGEALRTAFVALLGESVEAGTLQRAVTLDPSNPELHHRLGMVLYDSVGENDRAEGVRHLRRATELNPYVARYWDDLAWVCELDGDSACSTQGVRQAVKLSPMAPQAHWVAANTLLRAGQTDEAIAEFRRLLELDPTYAPATFHLCLGSLGDPQVILQRVLPPGKDPILKLAFLDYLSTDEEHENDELIHQVWVQVVGAGISFPLTMATPYVERLMGLGRAQEAQSAWRDMEKLKVIPNPSAGDEGNLIYNGDFEQTPLNTGLDWRNQPGTYVALDFEDPGAHTGKFCLRVDFTVSRNEEYAPLSQSIPVAPNQTYLLTAYVRSEEITSDSGPRLQVLDPFHGNGPNVMSETTVGTTPWHQISLQFCTGPDTNLVQLFVKRVRGRTYPTEITGSFWLDTVVLKALGAGGGSACTATGH